jgi:hexulose-6-phosphate isomerase
MKKGIYISSLPRELSLAEKMELAKKAGFEGIEISIADSGELTERCTPDELSAIREKADKIGIEILSVSCGLNWRCSFSAAEKSVRELAKQTVRNQIDIAKGLGVDAILVLPGFVTIESSFASGFPKDARYRPGDEVVDYEDAWDRALEALKELAPYAAEKGITMCVENVWNLFLLSPLEMRALIDQVGSDYVGVYFDVGNVMVQGYPEHWIKALGHRIKRVHFKDFHRKTSQFFGFCDLLTGDVDFKAVMSALRGIGYDGWGTAEQNLSVQQPEYTVYSSSIAMDYILGKKGGR